jgi:hypothetical protein
LNVFHSREVYRAGRRRVGYDHCVITFRELLICLVTGGVLVFFSLVPNLFQQLAEGLRDGVRNFRDSLSFRFPNQPNRYDRIETPRWWLAGSGVALIVASVLGYTLSSI